MSLKDKANVLAAGPQDETFEIPGAFLNPAWVTRFTVEFSKDKETWHNPIPFYDGGRDPEAVQRFYLPPVPKVDKDTGTVPVDPFEVRQRDGRCGAAGDAQRRGGLPDPRES